jgi:tyrosyl-tRNA synthetase
MNFIEIFKERGYLYQATNLEALEELTKNSKITAYIGFDATAASLHVGNLMQVMILRLLQQRGHKPIILIGGATTKIGDPSGKSELRKILSTEELAQNIESIKESLARFIKFGNGPSDAILVDNSSWLEKINYIEFLSKYGRLFSVNKMLTMDSVRTRLDREEPLTFLEFNYMLLQAYDFYHLNEAHNCNLQLGGSDQWGNIIMGVEFIRKMSGKECYGITTPLLTTSSGAKMGKSASGAVWLNSKMLSPYDYFQYWRNTEDQDVTRFAKLYAEFLAEEFAEFEQLAADNINSAKKQLAYVLTKLCHGKPCADQALDTATKLFEENSLSADMPTIELEKGLLDTTLTAVELFFISGLAPSKSEAKKLIRGGGAKINDIKIEDEQYLINAQDLQDSALKLSIGKKKHILVRFS